MKKIEVKFDHFDMNKGGMIIHGEVSFFEGDECLNMKLIGTCQVEIGPNYSRLLPLDDEQYLTAMSDTYRGHLNDMLNHYYAGMSKIPTIHKWLELEGS